MAEKSKNGVLTMAEIDERFDREWVLIGDPVTTRELDLKAGRVLLHSPDRDEVYRQAIALRPGKFAVHYVGKPPEGAAIVL